MANERTEPLQLNLGSLRSAMSLTLHTHHASRIWHGRAPTEGRPGIIGLNGFIGAMNKMKRGAEQDDPYSDWWIRLLDGAAVGGEDGGRERVRGAGRSSVADDVSIGDPDSSAPAN